MPPNFNEMMTTTARNRNMLKKKGEGSAADIKADKAAAKRQGMTPKEYEGSAADRRADIRGAIKKAVAESKGRNKKK